MAPAVDAVPASGPKRSSIFVPATLCACDHTISLALTSRVSLARPACTKSVTCTTSPTLTRQLNAPPTCVTSDWYVSSSEYAFFSKRTIWLLSMEGQEPSTSTRSHCPSLCTSHMNPRPAVCSRYSSHAWPSWLRQRMTPSTMYSTPSNTPFAPGTSAVPTASASRCFVNTCACSSVQSTPAWHASQITKSAIPTVCDIGAPQLGQANATTSPT